MGNDMAGGGDNAVVELFWLQRVFANYPVIHRKACFRHFGAVKRQRKRFLTLARKRGRNAGNTHTIRGGRKTLRDYMKCGREERRLNLQRLAVQSREGDRGAFARLRTQNAEVERGRRYLNDAGDSGVYRQSERLVGTFREE